MFRKNMIFGLLVLAAMLSACAPAASVGVDQLDFKISRVDNSNTRAVITFEYLLYSNYDNVLMGIKIYRGNTQGDLLVQESSCADTSFSAAIMAKFSGGTTYVANTTEEFKAIIEISEKSLVYETAADTDVDGKTNDLGGSPVTVLVNIYSGSEIDSTALLYTANKTVTYPKHTEGTDWSGIIFAGLAVVGAGTVAVIAYKIGARKMVI